MSISATFSYRRRFESYEVKFYKFFFDLIEVIYNELLHFYTEKNSQFKFKKSQQIVYNASFYDSGLENNK